MTSSEPQYPWDDDVHAEGTVLIDPWDGTYYAFYVSAPTTYPAGGQTMGRVVTVATSQDGKVWTRYSTRSTHRTYSAAVTRAEHFETNMTRSAPPSLDVRHDVVLAALLCFVLFGS